MEVSCNTGTKIMSLTGSLKFVWHWNTFMTERYCIEISSHRTSSLPRRAWLSLEILVLPECSVIPSLRRKQWWAHLITYHLKSSSRSHIRSSQTSGPLVFSFTKCAHFNHHLMHRVCINWLRKSFKVNTQMFQLILVRTFHICSAWCWIKIPLNAQVLTKSWKSILLSKG